MQNKNNDDGKRRDHHQGTVVKDVGHWSADILAVVSVLDKEPYYKQQTSLWLSAAAARDVIYSLLSIVGFTYHHHTADYYYHYTDSKAATQLYIAGEAVAVADGQMSSAGIDYSLRSHYRSWTKRGCTGRC